MKHTEEMNISGNIVDVINNEIFKGTLIIKNGRIDKIIKGKAENDHYILPGLIDAHIHIESSMVIPSEFARAAVMHGTVATVSDPHEIANVMGMEGVRFMINNGNKVNFKFYFGAPSCVPATEFETSGAILGIEETDELLKMNDIKYLSEMMNFPGVIYDDINIQAKLSLAKKQGKVIDGHAPGLRGNDLKKYIDAGISTDHECFTIEEAREKIGMGMKVLIREGSAAKNFETLIPLIDEFPDMIMLCSDDRHPDDLVKGHINELVKRAIKRQKPAEKDDVTKLINIIRSCTLNPKEHYKLDTGMLQTGDPADFITVDNLENFNVLATYINGEKVAEAGKTFIKSIIEEPINNFHCKKISLNDIAVKADSEYINVIGAKDGQLITEHIIAKAKIENNRIASSAENDILKIVVLNRYKKEDTRYKTQDKTTISNLPVVGFVKGFGIKQGAIASSIAHDSHNIIAVGVEDDYIVKVINRIIEMKGGIAYANNTEESFFPLPVAGIMSNDDIFKVSDIYSKINYSLKKAHIALLSPFMTLSFMALLVIPSLKISDKGLFDADNFKFVS